LKFLCAYVGFIGTPHSSNKNKKNSKNRLRF